MLKFIKTNGIYIGFWVLLSTLGLVGVYWAVRWAIIDATRYLDR